MCTNVITKYMGFATEYLMGKRNIINNDTLKMVNDTFVTIKSTINRKVGQIQNGIFLDKYLQSKVIIFLPNLIFSIKERKIKKLN